MVTMILSRTNDTLQSGALVPTYALVTLACIEEGDDPPVTVDGRNVFAAWVAPFDERRYTIPAGIVDAAARAGVVIAQ